MKRRSLIASIIVFIIVATLVLSSCSKVQTIVSYEAEDTDETTIQSIKSEEKNVVKTLVEDTSFYMNGVSEFVVDASNEHAVLNETSSSHVVNEKFELDIDSKTTGNKYDPNEVNVYGQFVSPSGELYEMPGFWYTDCDRYLDAIDEDGEFELKDYTISGGVVAKGVLDMKDDEKTPVAKITFSSTTSTSQQVGIEMNKSELNIRTGQNFSHVISIWLRKDESFTGDYLYLRLYSSKASNDTFFRIDCSELTTEWKKFSFVYSDGIYSKSQVEDFKQNYSIFIQTKGLDEVDGTTQLREVNGTIYASDFCFENIITYATGATAINSSFVLADFVAEDLENYKYGDINGKEVITIKDTGNFKIRFRFTEVGEWTFRVVMEKNNVTMCTYTSSVTATENPDEEKNRGIIEVEPTLKRNFMFEDGTPYAPIGMNVPYSVDPIRGSYDYDSYFPKMAAAGMNFSRTWLTFIGNGVANTEDGVLGYDSRQDKAYSFDHILDLAEEYGIYLQIPMMHTGWLRLESDNAISGKWNACPYNVANGGYLNEPSEFFTDERAKEDTKKLLRYYVARYGYSRNIMNWELYNEVGLVSGYDENETKEWADEMGSYLHSIDPYRHLVSMSSGNDYSDLCYTSEELDFTSFHSYIYGNQYAQLSVSETVRIYEWLDKPAMVGEIAGREGSESINYATDPDYYVLRQSPYVMFGGAGASSMMFYWQMCDKYDLYSVVTPAVKLFELLPNKWITMPQIKASTTNSDETNVLYQSGRSISVWGFKDNTSAYIYMMDNQYSFANTSPLSKTDTVLNLKDMQDGEYTIRFFDTQKGVVYETITASASKGKLTISVPEWSTDIALLIEKA